MSILKVLRYLCIEVQLATRMDWRTLGDFALVFVIAEGGEVGGNGGKWEKGKMGGGKWDEEGGKGREVKEEGRRRGGENGKVNGLEIGETREKKRW